MICILSVKRGRRKTMLQEKEKKITSCKRRAWIYKRQVCLDNEKAEAV